MSARLTEQELAEMRSLIGRWAYGFEDDDIVRAYRKLLDEFDAVRAELSRERDEARSARELHIEYHADTQKQLDAVRAERDVAVRALDIIASMNPAGSTLGNDEGAGQCGQCDRSMQLREESDLDEVQICDACAQEMVAKMEQCAFATLREMRAKSEAAQEGAG